MYRFEHETTEWAAWSVPAVSDELVVVEAVSGRLSDAVGRVALVLAPAGYGKTSQVAAWAAAEHRCTAWATIDPLSNDPDQLLSTVLGMLHHVAGVDPGEWGNMAVGTDPQETASALGRLVQNCRVPFVLVLDDAHHIEHGPAADLLQAVVDHVPSESTVVLIARSAPHLALARLRSYANLVDVTTGDLALDADAARRWIDSMGVRVADTVVERLVTETEGWPIGIRMGSLTECDASADGVSSQHLSIGHDHAIADFVREEWLRDVPDDAVEFLERASCLDSMTAPMCDDVLERCDSGNMLERGHRSLMLVALDSRNDRFRMHRLLREVLYDTFDRIDPIGRRRVDLRASEWFERHGDADRAIQLAVRAGRIDRATHLVDSFAPKRLASADFTKVNRWLGWLSTETTMSSATLCVTASAVALSSGNPAAAAQWMRFADQAAASESYGDGFLQLEALRAPLSPRADADALAHARHAYERLPPGEWHAVACFGYGVLSSILGDDETAMAVLVEGAAEARLLGAATVEAQCLANQAVVVGVSDDWARATTLARSARALQREHGLDELPQMVMVTSMSALIEAMAGELAASRDDIARSRRSLTHLAPLAGWANIRARILLAEASLVLGDRVGAQTLLDEVEPMVRDNPALTRSVDQVEHLKAQLSACRAALPFGPSSLTAAELRLLPLLSTNLTLSEIAKRLFVSRNTAKSHAASIYRKLGVSARGEAVDLARSVGLLVGDVVSPTVDRWSSPSAGRDELLEHPEIVEVAVNRRHLLAIEAHDQHAGGLDQSARRLDE